jgi:hypothetical protein
MEAPGEKLIIRLWETLVEKGIGGLLRPWQLRREERARLDVRREELITLAQGERDAEDIRAGRKELAQVGGALVALPSAPMPERLPVVSECASSSGRRSRTPPGAR